MARIEYLSVKNWQRFQHYRDRRPDWIKLYSDLLDDFEFAELPDAMKAHAVLIWLLASRLDNKIPNDPKYVAQRIGARGRVNLEALLKAGWLVPFGTEAEPEKWPTRYIPAAVRQQIMERDKVCVDCGSADNLEIDHVTPISRGGTGDPDNLAVRCASCNRKKRQRTGSERAEQVATQMRSLETETETETETEVETEKEKDKETTEPRVVVDEDAVSKVIIAANRGMRQGMGQDGYRPIDTSHASRQSVIDWMASGIPFSVIELAVFATATKARKQIASMAYFGAAVREAWERKRAELPPGSQARDFADSMPRDDEGNVNEDGYYKAQAGKRTAALAAIHENDEADARRVADEEARVAAWAEAHPDEAAAVKKAVEAWMFEKHVGALAYPIVAERIARNEYRRLVLETKLRPVAMEGAA